MHAHVIRAVFSDLVVKQNRICLEAAIDRFVHRGSGEMRLLVYRQVPYASLQEAAGLLIVLGALRVWREAQDAGVMLKAVGDDRADPDGGIFTASMA